MIYYLDGSAKKGPYSKEELKELNLNTETLVYSDKWKNWQKIKEIPELLDYLSNTHLEEYEIPIKINAEQPTITVKPIFIHLCIIISAAILSYIFVSLMKKQDYEKITNEVNNFFSGNQSIADIDVSGVEGEFRKLSRNPFYKDILTDEVGFEKEKDVYDKNGNNPQKITFFKEIANATKYKDWIKIVDYFDVESRSTSRNLSIIRKESDSKFTFNNIVFLDMAYFVPEYVAYDYGYGVSGKNPSYRPSVNKAYNDAALFLIEDKGVNYVKESSNKIWSFDQIESDFYKIGSLYPKYLEHPAEYMLEEYSKRNEGLRIYNSSKENDEYTFMSFSDKDSEKKFNLSYQFTYDRYMTSNANISDSQSIVWYCEMTNRYHIEEKENIFYKQILIYSPILILLLNIIYFIFKNRKKIKFV